MAQNYCLRIAPIICKITERCYPVTLKKMKYSFKTMKRPDPEKLKYPVQNDKGVSTAVQIAQRIKLSGAISVADYMKEVLTNPMAGYYMNRDVFGAAGDFITSPEISQIFGDILGVWLVSEWQKLSMPRPLQIVEFGPGRGTLLSDIMKITNQVELNKDNLSIHLIEVSPTMQRLQGDRLCLSYTSKDDMPHYAEGETISGVKVYWYKDLKNVPKNFSLYIAHEFFDALPIHRFTKTVEGWREILIDMDPTSTDPEHPKLRYVLSPEETRACKLYIQAVLGDSSPEQLEVSPQGLSIAKELAARVEEHGGIALIVDYGHDGTKTDTFRAFKKHKQTDPLQDVGTSDLTADVDFSQLRRAAAQAKVLGPVTQRQFLEAAFANIRQEMILKNAKPEEQEIFKSGYDMLTNPAKMGEVFKFMAIFPNISKEHYAAYPVLGFPGFPNAEN